MRSKMANSMAKVINYFKKGMAGEETEQMSNDKDFIIFSNASTFADIPKKDLSIRSRA